MNAKRMRLLVPFLLATFLFSACAPLPPPGTALTPEERAAAQRRCIATQTLAGAAVGALGGFLLSGGEAKGAAIGAGAGGALAFAVAWGNCLAIYSDLTSYPAATARETARRTGYKPSQGDVVKIERFTLNPTGVAPEGKVNMAGSYYVLTPDGEKEVKVVETRVLSFLDPETKEWKVLGDVDQEVTAANGTRRAEGNFDIPADAPEGQYRVTLKVTANGKSDQVIKDLTVKKGMAMGATKVAESGEKGSKSVGSKSKKKKAKKKR